MITDGSSVTLEMKNGMNQVNKSIHSRSSHGLETWRTSKRLKWGTIICWLGFTLSINITTVRLSVSERLATATGGLLHYTKNSLFSPCTSRRKYKEKDRAYIDWLWSVLSYVIIIINKNNEISIEISVISWFVIMRNIFFVTRLRNIVNLLQGHSWTAWLWTDNL